MRIRPEWKDEWREEEIEGGRCSGEKIDRINNKEHCDQARDLDQSRPEAANSTIAELSQRPGLERALDAELH